MNEISIVKRRTRLLPLVLTLLVVGLLILGVLLVLGMLPGVAPTGIDVHHIIDSGGTTSTALLRALLTDS